MNKHYGGVHALKDVDFSLNQGEIHCLIGQNGCGKSTMIKVISGVIGVDPGSEVILDGKKSTGGLARQAMAAGVRVIYQDLSIFPNLTVAENIAFDQHVDSAVKGVNWSRMYKKAQEVLDRMKIQLDLDVLVEELSIADRQLVAIARALATNAKLLIMDEPTAPLTDNEVEILFELVRKFKRKKGVSIIYISHRLDEIFELSDRVTVMRDGQMIKTAEIQDITKNQLIFDMVGRELTETYPKRNPKYGDKLLEVKGVCGPSNQETSFCVREGGDRRACGPGGRGQNRDGQAHYRSR